MSWVPLGDEAVLGYFANEAAAVRCTRALRAINPPWLVDVVPAYASVGVFFDPAQMRLTDVLHFLSAAEEWTGTEATPTSAPPAWIARIPVCYEMQLDMARVCDATGLNPEAVIRLHTATIYTVYAIGFVPGFPYLGYLPPPLCGVSRLPAPRLRVAPGSVGLTGRQTGIYPLPRPGGWNLIGRTPLVIVDVAEGFFPLRVGDQVQFERIDERQFRELEGERLPRPHRAAARDEGGAIADEFAS
ncbi:MAG: carboxyltransferase domain-containing protein [Gemmataceae bacterium]|nr:allophanate hydrolase subunit 1 [Gemmata sp.]MDW8198286.1 carboxyltransferase domain-containing protein [Gemmataceae bacterium]